MNLANTNGTFFFAKYIQMEKDLERIDKLIVLLRELSEYQDKLNRFVLNEISDNNDYHEFIMDKFQQPFSTYFDAIKDNLLDMLIVDFAFTRNTKNL